MRRLIIALDFDNTITIGFGRFPAIYKLRPKARDVINTWFDKGHNIIINTCRSDASNAAQKCIDFLAQNGVKYTRINSNLPETIEHYGTDTRKISAELYFDDRNPTPVDWDVFDAVVKKYEKPTIIAIIGESGVGKSISADHIKDVWGINLVESRTTRAPRFEGENGHTFITKEEFDSYSEEDMVAHAEHGSGDFYCCLKSDLKSVNTYVINEAGLKQLAEKKDDYNLFSIRILRPDESRVKAIGKARAARDEGNYNMLNEEFDAVVANVGSEEDLFDLIDGVITDHQLYI